MGIRAGSDDSALIARMARGMFDTTGKVDPFAPDSPIKEAAIEEFPKQFFLVLRVVQLFRGLASRTGVDFALAAQWAPFARQLLQRQKAHGGDGGDGGDGLPEARHGRFYGI